MARVITEAHAAVQLLRLGYAVQAFTLVGSMLELVHIAAYIGADDLRANEYFQYTDSRYPYPPGGIKKTIKAVGELLQLPAPTVEREYDDLYRQICMVKHGNPMAMGLGTETVDGFISITTGPVVTDATLRLGFSAAQLLARYSLLGVTGFVLHHVRGARSDDWFGRLSALSQRQSEANAASASVIPPLGSDE